MAFGVGDWVALVSVVLLVIAIAWAPFGNWLAIKTTLWVGSLSFLLLHAIVWWGWTRFYEGRPYELLTMVLSLEAIVTNTLTLLGLNLLAQRQSKTHASQEQVTGISRQIAEVLATVQTNEITLRDHDSRLAEIQTAHDEHR